MDDPTLFMLQNGQSEDVIRILSAFNSKNSQVFKFPDITKVNKNKFAEIATKLLSSTSHSCWSVCLESLRIISRDKDDVNELATCKLLTNILRIAGLHWQSVDDLTKQEENQSLILEAQKTLCNLIFNSCQAQRFCCSNGCIEGIINRLKTYKDPNLPMDIKFFDMRILFLLTALCTGTRARLRNDLHGLVYLAEVLDLIVNEDVAGDVSMLPKTLSNVQVNLASEILKVLFNLTIGSSDSELDEEEEAHYLRLVSILHDLILSKTDDKTKKQQLLSHTINLLTNMPPSSFEELMTPHTECSDAAQCNKDVEYDGMNVQAILQILLFLENQLDNANNSQNLKEVVAPVLACLCECCKGNRIIRKYVRSKVLPPLRDVHHRPEEGSSIRNRLCKMMTSPNIDLKNLSAEFIFILCKHSVKRFVKYSGYGNAAGLLASRGLMLGNRGKSNSFSSESDDSDTEEYTSQKDKINPIIGCYEEPHLDPLAEMTEEQKEYEAMKLVNMMDKLAREKVIQPTRIGANGKPQPVEHILELQEPSSSVNDDDSTASVDER